MVAKSLDETLMRFIAHFKKRSTLFYWTQSMLCACNNLLCTFTLEEYEWHSDFFPPLGKMFI